jgi:hypothetical protein
MKQGFTKLDSLLPQSAFPRKPLLHENMLLVKAIVAEIWRRLPSCGPGQPCKWKFALWFTIESGMADNRDGCGSAKWGIAT